MDLLSTLRFMRKLCCLLALTLASLVLVACGEDDDETTSPESAQKTGVESPQSLLGWMADHPENAGLVALTDDGRPLIDFGGDGRFPLASTRKVLIAGALIASESELTGTIPRGDVERFYVPGTDGGAHEKAGLDEPRLSESAVAQAMIEDSDNASLSRRPTFSAAKRGPTPALLRRAEGPVAIAASEPLLIAPFRPGAAYPMGLSRPS